MTDRDPTPFFPRPVGMVSARALSDLSGLIAGLDQLEHLQPLPDYPKAGDPGIQLGRFQLRARLGIGSHGSVYLADDLRLGRRVAVKVPKPVVLADPEARERFLREARAVAVLDHPGIVQVYEAGDV